MRLKIVYPIFALLMLFSLASTAQVGKYTIINKNVKASGLGLSHDLNVKGDSIIVNSDKIISRISFLSYVEKETIKVYLNGNKAIIPLHHFDVGMYTIAIYCEDKIIVFDIYRQHPIDLPENIVVDNDLEESILRSSLSEEEQLKRNIKPRKPKVSDAAVVSVSNKKEKPKRRRKVNMPATAEKYVGISERAEAIKKKKALEEKEKAEAEPLAQENTVAKAENLVDTDSASKEVKKIASYNLTEIDNDKTLEKQTRSEYRKENLRPNGTKYDDEN